LNGEDEKLTSILSKFPFLVDLRKDNKTPLFFAIEGYHISTCHILLNLGVDMFLKPSQNQVYWLI